MSSPYFTLEAPPRSRTVLAIAAGSHGNIGDVIGGVTGGGIGDGIGGGIGDGIGVGDEQAPS